MRISYTEGTARSFRNWVAIGFRNLTVAHPKGSNDNDRPGGVHPMAAIAHNPSVVDARAAEAAHRMSFRS